MASSRDDFIIAIRSAFLKKSTKQKFSLLTLVFFSIFIIVLSSFDFKAIRLTKSFIKEIVYRSSFIISIPENFIKSTYFDINEYSNFYKKYKITKEELDKLKSENISTQIIKSENQELKSLIDGYSFTTNKILAKVIVDHESPFLRSIIINKGSKEKIKIGTNIYDRSYLVGRVIEVNYTTSRVLLLTDLNSNIPISITPGNIQAIVAGNGKNFGEVKYIKNDLIDKIENKGIAYTSGTGSIFKSGIPVGVVRINEESQNEKILIDFFSDFTQLKYVLAEIETSSSIIEEIQKTDKTEIATNTEKIKLDLISEELDILQESNTKYLEENRELNSITNELNKKIETLQLKNNLQKKIINQHDIDKEELEFLRLNLIYSSKCQSKKLFSSGFKVGTPEYKKCIMNKGKIDD
ncbi:rod shape-determining protein MreC [Candidatus Pelagibacter sp.]|nr:rod shape-determining protein MreC [Candidatus Pelagibacter sp.]